MEEAFAFAALEECEVETEIDRSYRGYRFRKDEPAVALAAQALELRLHTLLRAHWRRRRRERLQRARHPLRHARKRDGRDPHPDEHIAVSDVKAMVDVSLALLDGARLDGAA